MDDGTCIQGSCMDSRFDAFNPSATYDDGSCPPALLGCMHSTASNYRALATLEDGSCLYQGCIDSNAINHDPSATLPGECINVVLGCLDSAALNFYEGANTASGNCAYAGCTDSLRPNYNPTATIDDGLCAPLYPGCTSSLATNYEPIFNVDDGSCRVAGCTDSDSSATFNVPCLCNGACAANRRRKLSGTDDCWDPEATNYRSDASSGSGCVYNTSGCTDSGASNYLGIANIDDGGCTFSIYGCTDATAINFDSTATVLEGCVATYPGCTDSSSTSYVASDNSDDGSCLYPVYGCADAGALNFDSVATLSVGCRARVEGCMDSVARNFAADANTAANHSCISVTNGCMASGASNFDSLANSDDGSCVVESSN